MSFGARGVLACAMALACLLAPATASAAVYWGGNSWVGAANTDGSMPIVSYPSELANQLPGAFVTGVAVNGTHLFWSDNGRGAIGRMTLSSAADGWVAYPEPGPWIDRELVPGVERPWGIAADAGHIYWASTAGAIGRANIDGSAADRAFIDGLDSPCGIAVDSQYVYWGEFGPGTIGRARLDGSEVEPEFITGAADPCGVAVDAGHVYWSNAGSIGRTDLDGGAAPSSPFIPNAGHPCGVAVDADHVYWTNFVENGTFVSRADLAGNGAGRLVGVDYYQASCGVALDSRVFQPRLAPLSLPVRFGTLKRRKQGRLLILPVYAPERGELTLTSPAKLGWHLDKGPEPPPWRGGSFRWKLELRPGKGRVGKRILRQLRRKGRAPVNLTFNWEQLGRRPVTATRYVVFAPPTT